MSYDSAKSRSLLSIAGAHASNPAAEYIDAIILQLKDAEVAIGEAVAAKLKAEGEANRYAAELASAQATIRRMHEEAAKPTVEPALAKAKRPKQPAAEKSQAPIAPVVPIAPPAAAQTTTETTKRVRKAKPQASAQ